MRETSRTGGSALARTLVMGLALCIVLLAVCAAAAAALTRVSVRPAKGGPRTRFVVRFRAPERTGRVGDIRRTDRLYAAGPKAPGCIASVRLTLPAVRRGAHVTITLRPRPATKWCAGRFQARIVRTEAFICPGVCAGPNIPPPRTIARFSFRVRRAATNPTPTPTPTPSPGSSPTFAGIKTATLCNTGTAPQVPAPSRTYSVSWDPATDPATPSDKIVYDIFYSSTPGGENFASPLATTGPGQTSYSGTLPGSGAAYFVVRARDTAGHEDTNRVEKQAVNTC